MKMLKKIAATVMAAAMSLAMLTACGGGGGSTTQYKMAKVLAESQKTGKVYSDITTTIDAGLFNKELTGQSIKVNAKTAADSKAGKTCTLLDIQGKKMMVMVTNDGSTYEISTDKVTGERYWSKIGSNAMLGTVASAVPSNSDISKLQIRPDYKYNGTSYYAEVINADGTEIAYCFDGDNLVYIVMNVSGVQIAEKVNEISGHFPAQVDPKLPMSYDEFMNLPTKG